MRIGMIGGGYMGEALVSAVLKEGVAKPAGVTVADIAAARRDFLSSEYGISTTDDNVAAAKDADVVVVAVKPQEFDKVAAGLRGRLGDKQTIVSIMAGVPSARIAKGFDHGAVVRVMPNTAAQVGQAMSVWLALDGVGDEGIANVQRFLRSAGRELRVSDEKYLDMATALSGSGPGFIFFVLEALIDAGVHIGLRRDQAEELVLQTVFGSACLASQTGKHPAELRNMVTSPAGTTAAGLQVLDEASVRGALIAAVEAAYERAKELGE